MNKNLIRSAERVRRWRPAIPPRRSERTFPASATLQVARTRPMGELVPLLTAPAKVGEDTVDFSYSRSRIDTRSSKGAVRVQGGHEI